MKEIKDWRARCESMRRWQGDSHGDPLTCDEAITLLDEVERLRAEGDALRTQMKKLKAEKSMLAETMNDMRPVFEAAKAVRDDLHSVRGFWIVRLRDAVDAAIAKGQR
jgi:predicted nuclease with TOPRIM domain